MKQNEMEKKNVGIIKVELNIKMMRSTLVGQWVKDLVLPLLWHRVQSLAQKLPHVVGKAKKKKKFTLEDWQRYNIYIINV